MVRGVKLLLDGKLYLSGKGLKERATLIWSSKRLTRLSKQVLHIAFILRCY